MPITFTPTFTTSLTIKPGSSSFSTPPTVSEINASSDVNQIIAATNYYYYALNGSIPLSYMSTSDTIKASMIYDIRSTINTVRNQLGIGQHTWAIPDVSITVNQTALTTIFSELKTALNLTKTIGVYATKEYRRIDAPYNTKTSDSLSTTLSYMGKEFVAGPGCLRRRELASYDTSGLDSISAGVLLQKVTLTNIVPTLSSNWRNILGDNADVDIYLSNSDDSAYASASVADNINNYLATMPYGTNGLGGTIILDKTALIPFLGSNKISLIAGITDELANAGATSHSVDATAPDAGVTLVTLGPLIFDYNAP